MNIYIVFSATPYRMGRFIRKFTGEEYNHVSIALDEELNQMYGFARRFYRTPFYGGFVKESLSRYHLGEEAAIIRVCRLPVTAQQYQHLKQLLETMHAQRQQYLYNYLSAATAVLRHPVRLTDAYTCIEFCVNILDDIGIQIDPKKYYTVGDVEKMLRPHTVYTGPAPKPDRPDDEFFAKKPVPYPISTTVVAIAKLFRRL